MATPKYRLATWSARLSCAAEFAPAQKQGLLDLIGIYVGRMRDGHASIRMQEIAEHLDDTHFVWVGGLADDSVFYGTYYDPSDLTGWIGGPAYFVPPASVVPTAERLDRPADRGACRSETVPVPTPGGAERSVTITRC